MGNFNQGGSDESARWWRGMALTTPTVSSEPNDASWRPGFGEYLLAGIVILMVLGLALTAFLYLLPPEHAQLSELQPAFVVAPEPTFPVGSSRLVNWGEQVILVVRTGPQAFAGVSGVSTADGCILNWDPTSLRILSPCTYIVYDLQGNVVRGLTKVPLERYPVFVRDGLVYVGRP